MQRLSLRPALLVVVSSTRISKTAPLAALSAQPFNPCQLEWKRTLHTGNQNHNTKSLEYQANIGEAIRGIQHDLSRFPRHAPYYTHIYATSIMLYDPHHTQLRLQGRALYLSLWRGLRWSVRWYYYGKRDQPVARLQILAVHPPSNSGIKQQNGVNAGGNSLKIRWRFEGQRQPSWWTRWLNRARASTNTASTTSAAATAAVRSLTALTPFPVASPSSNASQAEPDPLTTVYEGVFTYRFNEFGRVCEHRIEHIEPTPGPRLIDNWRIRLLRWWPIGHVSGDPSPTTTTGTTNSAS